MYSTRFQRTIVIIRHAQMRMDERGINDILLLDVIDSGETRYRDATHLWVFKDFSERSDNLLFAVLVPAHKKFSTSLVYVHTISLMEITFDSGKDASNREAWCLACRCVRVRMG